jgi:sodium transport system permease protein
MPMLLLLFIFVGCIYIAIDITAGEKERRTLQTLFTAPLHVSEIIAGKFFAVSAVGIVSATMNLLSLVVAIMLQARLMGGNLNQFSLSVSIEGWLWLAVLVLLSTVFLASLSLAVCLLANSYKESQSYVSPLMMLVLIPSMMSQMPGMELNASTALIPILNICLAIGAVFKGTLVIKWMALVVLFALIYAFLGLYLASRTFGNESIITGEKVNWKAMLRKG